MRISDWSSDVCSSDLPTESTPVPAEVVASVTPASVPDASVSDSVRTEAMPAEPSADAESTPETAPAPAPAKQSDKSVPDGKAAPKNVVNGVDYVTINGGEPFDTPKGQIEVRSEEHTSELQSLMRISYAVF